MSGEYGKVSVIIPVYNSEKTLKRCIESVLQQTYENIEVLLIDDGSTDKSPDILEEYEKKDNRVIVLHKKNGGVSSARNAALKLATGEYIASIDSDDYIDCDMYQKMLNSMKQIEADICICGHICETKVGQEFKGVSEQIILDKYEAMKLLIEDDFIQNYHWDKIFCKKLFDNLFYPENQIYEDMFLNHFLFDRANKVVVLPNKFYHYVVSDESISSDKNPEKRYRHMRELMKTQISRRDYFETQSYESLSLMSLAKVVPYIYTCIYEAYTRKDTDLFLFCRDYLANNKSQIKLNDYLSEHDKKVYEIYAGAKYKCVIYLLFKRVMSYWG